MAGYTVPQAPPRSPSAGVVPAPPAAAVLRVAGEDGRSQEAAAERAEWRQQPAPAAHHLASPLCQAPELPEAGREGGQ